MIARLMLLGLFVLGLRLPVNAGAVELSERLDILLRAYPKHIVRIDGNRLVMTDGTVLIIDDGQQKTHQQKLVNPDIEDMLSQIYPVGPCFDGASSRNFDPGRIRVGAFFKAIYGRSSQDVRSRTVTIGWFGTKLNVTNVGDADKALRRVANDLDELDASMRTFFVKTAGTFNWRKISGTNRLSVHSFAAAIDINVDHADYWRWAGGKPGNVPRYKNRIPMEIVEIFERHGFIWGGKWYHFDTMHFEYRPEIIRLGRLVAERGCLS